MMYRIHPLHGTKYTVQTYNQTTYHDWVDVVDEPLEYDAAFGLMNNLARVASRFTHQPVVAIATISTRAFVAGKEVETV